MVAPPEVLLVPKFIIMLAGLIVPGAALMRALRLPASLATSFVGSILALYATVLALQLGNITISFGTLTAGLLAITLAARFARRRAEVAPSRPLLTRLRQYNPVTGMGWWAPLYFVFLAAVLWRAWHEPLAGPDVEFRWTFLAEQMLRLGSLDFYPPRSAEDFVSYFWVESIPPGASALHAWAYACAGSAKPSWTIPAVILQVWTLHALLWRVAERIGGVPAARFACLAAAACPLLTWSVLIGQETGLTALSVLGMAYGIYEWSETRASHWAALVGVFAAVGASAREYGLVFPTLAIAGLVATRADRRAWVGFFATAAISIIWPLRTWILTGNPFYSLTAGGIFPANERFVAWIEHDADTLGAVLHSGEGWKQVARYVLLYASTAVLGWFAIVTAALRGFRHAALALLATAVALGLWAASVRYTNGGLFYSLRVMSPALALGSLAAGLGLATFVASRPRSATPTSVILALLVVFLLPATMVLPRHPWRTSTRDWPGFTRRTELPLGATDETVKVVLNAISRSPPSSRNSSPVVLADSPGFQRRFLPLGIRVVPLWSPQADWLFDRQLAPAEAVRRWQLSGVSHLILTKWQVNVDFFNAHARWTQPPFQLQLVGETTLNSVFAIRAIE